MPPHIRGFVHKTLHLMTPTILCQQTINRPTVALVVAPMLQSGSPLQELKEFIKEDDNGMIMPIIIYVDDKVDCKELTVQHRLLLEHDHNKENDLVLIRPFSRACSAEYQAKTLDLVEKGICRVIYATASASNGLDFPGIRRVVQYGMEALTLDFCAFVQRLGRCGRNSDDQCMAVVFAPNKYLLPRLPHSQDELEDRFGKYREPMGRIGSQNMAQLYDRPFQKITPAMRVGHRGNSTSSTSKRPLHEVMNELDPMFLWFLNTTGCRRHLMLSYFDDPEAENFTLPHGFICCDVCEAYRKDPRPCTGISLEFSLSNYLTLGKVKKTTRNKAAITTADHKHRACILIKKWRDTLWQDESLFPMNKYTSAEALLDTTAINALASYAARIKTIDDIRIRLGKTWGWDASIFKDYGKCQVPYLSFYTVIHTNHLWNYSSFRASSISELTSSNCRGTAGSHC